MKSIRLTTPVQHNDENPAVELNPSNLERWLNELPVDDIIETVKKLDETVSAFNELKVAASNRLNLLEIYFSAFHKILQGYDEMRIAQLKMSAKQKQQLSNNIMWLYIKLSHGYKIIVKNNAGNPKNSKQPQYLLLALFRALELTVISLLYAYRFGMDAPPFTYLELHQLYVFAEYNELLYKPIKAARGYAKTPTIASFYTLALVFISIDPRQYESYTLDVLFLALQPFSFNCSITRTFESTENSYIYKINLSENQPPIILVNNEINSFNKWTRYLDIEKFIAEINAWLDENKDNKNTLLIENELELFPAVITRLKVSRNEKNISTVESHCEIVTAKSLKLIVGLSQLESLLIMKSVDLGMKLNYRVSEWTVQSESSTDCELASNINTIDDELSLGELVAIVNDDEEGKPISLLKIAYICALQQFEQGVLFARLEYLSSSAYPLTYIMISGGSEVINATQSNGIYLLDDGAKDDSPLIIVNRLHYREMQRYLIKTREKICKVVATDLVKQTLHYSFFKFEIVQEERTNISSTTNIFNIAV